MVRPGFYCDITIEPVSNIDGSFAHEYDVSLACDDPKFYEETVTKTVDEANKWLTPRLLKIQMECLIPPQKS